MTQDFFNRIERIDHLIKIKGTGTPEKFAERLGISRRCLYDYINKMKEGGAPIKYDQCRPSFYYEEEGNFILIRFMKLSTITVVLKNQLRLYLKKKVKSPNKPANV